MTASRTDFLTAYTEGFAELLADAGIGLSWQPDGNYPTGQVGIFIAAVPTQPLKIVTLTPTPMATNPTLTSAQVNLQIRFRAGPDIRDVWALRDATRTVLQGMFPVRLPTGVWVASLTFAYGTSMGQDDSRNQLWADNYRSIAAEHPAA